MDSVNVRQEPRRAIVFAVGLSVCLLCLSAPTARAGGQRQAQQQQQQVANPARQLLSQANFYYSSDDTSDRAADQYRLVIRKYPQTTEAETAQYYLASYYQRKYYVLRERAKKDDRTALQAAIQEYRAYTTNYFKRGTHQWLADAFFNLALAHQQLGDLKNAGYELDKMYRYASLDNNVYVYQVVWSPRYDDVIDGYLSTAKLALSAQGLVTAAPDANAFVAALKKWCQQNKTKTA